MTKIKDSVVLLTGASSGIGEALTYELSQKGAKLIIAARRKSELDRVKADCAHPENVQILTLDLGDAFALSQKAKGVESFFGAIDLLIHCGGVSQRDRAIETDLDTDRKLMEVNYFGTITLTKALLPQFVKKKSGHIVVITSAHGILSTANRSSYSAAKHALHGFFDALRAEHHDDGLKITMVLPGYIKTNISVNALTGDGNTHNQKDETHEQGMTAEECARRIVIATERNKEEVYIGGFKEVAGIYVKRFFPSLFSKIVRKAVK